MSHQVYTLVNFMKVAKKEMKKCGNHFSKKALEVMYEKLSNKFGYDLMNYHVESYIRSSQYGTYDDLNLNYDKCDAFKVHGNHYIKLVTLN